MLTDRYLFSQLMDFLPRHEFNRCVALRGGNRRIRNFSCYDQFLCMAFAQLTYRESLRDIEICLRTVHRKLYHAGFRGASHGAHWPTPTSDATGASTPISPGS